MKWTLSTIQSLERCCIMLPIVVKLNFEMGIGIYEN